MDDRAPAVTLTDRGTTIRGTSTFAATASDANSGVTQVQLQYQRTGTNTWVTMCTVTDVPYSCRFDITTPTEPTASRQWPTDAAGNSAITAATSGRTVDNTVASVSLEDPCEYLTGTVSLSAKALAWELRFLGFKRSD